MGFISGIRRQLRGCSFLWLSALARWNFEQLLSGMRDRAPGQHSAEGTLMCEKWVYDLRMTSVHRLCTADVILRFGGFGRWWG